jgi:hypothetical protein
MNSRYVLCCVIGVLLLAVPCTSRAQGRRYGRSGVVQGPDGPLYDTRSPEWRMSGGNLFVYEQIMEEKMMLQQQKLMMRQQQQQMLRQTQQAARKKAQRAAEPVAISGQYGAGANDPQSGTLPARRRKKSLTTPRANAPAASSQKKSGATSTPASAPSSKPSTTSSAPLEPSDSP